MKFKDYDSFVNENETLITYADVTKTEGYEKMIEMGWVDASNDSQKANVNVFFMFPAAHIVEEKPGALDKITRSSHEFSAKPIGGRVLDQALCVYSNGYVRLRSKAMKQDVVLVSKYKGNMDTLEKWNEYFEFCLQYTVKIAKGVEKHNCEMVLYPGPEKRGYITGKKIGII